MTIQASKPVVLEPLKAPQVPPKRRRRKRLPYLLLAPAVLALLVGMGYPLGWQVFNSFREYGLAQQFGQAPEWVGFANYAALLSDSLFWSVLLKSVAFMAATAGATMVIGIGLALLMKVIPTWSRIALQVAMLVAWAMPIVAQMTVWNWLLNDRNGVLNDLLSNLPGIDLVGH